MKILFDVSQNLGTGTTQASEHKARSDQKYAESTQLRLRLSPNPEIIVKLLLI